MNNPSPEALKAFAKAHKLTGAKAARMTYLASDRQWRKFTGGDTPRHMSQARLFCLVAHTMCAPDLINRIEAAMALVMEETP